MKHEGGVLGKRHLGIRFHLYHLSRRKARDGHFVEVILRASIRELAALVLLEIEGIETIVHHALLNVLCILGMVITAILASQLENLLSSAIALTATGIFAAAEFLILHAPDVAISEAAVGAALVPLIFIVTIKKIRRGDRK